MFPSWSSRNCVPFTPSEPMGKGSTDAYLLARMPGADIENVKVDWRAHQSAGRFDSWPNGNNSHTEL